MAGFAINPPNKPITMADGRTCSNEWYRWFAQVQRVTGDDLIAQLQAAPYLTYTPNATLSADKVLTQGAGMSFTSTATTFTIALAVSGVTAATYGSASQVSQITVDQYGRATTVANVTITPAAIGAVPIGTTVTAGAGLTGGGDLSANRTFDVGAGTGIAVNANDVALDTANTRNTDHAGVTLTAGAGLTGGGTIEASRTFTVGAGTGITVNADDVAITNTAVTPASYGSATQIATFTVNQQGQLTAAANVALTAASVGAPDGLFDHYTTADNSTTTETDLYSDTIAAGQLAANGAKLAVEYGGVFVSSATATRQIKIYFAGTAIFDSGALTLSLSAAWTIYATIIRVSSSVVRYMISMTTEGAALAAYTAAGELTGLTLANSAVLKVTGQAAGVGAASADISARLGSVVYYPPA